MPKKLKPKREKFTVSSLPRTASAAQIRSAAADIGGDPVGIERMMTFIDRIEFEINNLELTPQQVSNTAISLLAMSLHHCPPEQRESAVSAIFQALWTNLGLKPH